MGNPANKGAASFSHLATLVYSTTNLNKKIAGQKPDAPRTGPPITPAQGRPAARTAEPGLGTLLPVPRPG
ncbi:hypothetical protein [Streptomyces sp. NPDC001401]|uniref:hypothetical protein n=1 Tax=Streptomyces sp. NPDC001401 TaxID=3364570 RepID=UPI003674C0BA